MLRELKIQSCSKSLLKLLKIMLLITQYFLQYSLSKKTRLHCIKYQNQNKTMHSITDKITLIYFRICCTVLIQPKKPNFQQTLFSTFFGPIDQHMVSSFSIFSFQLNFFLQILPFSPSFFPDYFNFLFSTGSAKNVKR